MTIHTHHALLDRPSSQIEPSVVNTPVGLITTGAGGVQAGVNLDSNGALLDLMDGV